MIEQESVVGYCYLMLIADVRIAYTWQTRAFLAQTTRDHLPLLSTAADAES